MEARDGVADDVDCGPDEDSAFTDSVDTRVNCDPAPAADGGGGGAGSGGGDGRGGTPTLQRVVVSSSFKARALRTATVFTKLTVKSVDAGSRVTAKCRTRRGKKCASTKDFSKRSAPATLRLTGFEKRTLPVGAKLEIRVLKPGMIGAVKVLTIRKGKKPSVTTRCLGPGATRPHAC